MSFFFVNVGSFVGVVVYFVLLESAGVAGAAPIALAVHLVYVALAVRAGEGKQFDVGLGLLFAVATIAVLTGVEPIVALYRRYSPPLLFATLALVALVPLVLGRRTFTRYYAERQFPRWQQALPEFGSINRLITGWWVVLFSTAALLAAWAPTDWRFTLLWPNLLILVAGIPAPLWMIPLYLRLFPAGPPTAIEPLLMGMPFAFASRAARDVRACIEFRVSGPEAGDYHLRIDRGRCRSFAGRADRPDLTVHTPDAVWLRIAHGEIDGARALADGLYRAEGDVGLLARLREWFPPRSGAPHLAPPGELR